MALDQLVELPAAVLDGVREGAAEGPRVAGEEPVEGPAEDPVPIYVARLTEDDWVEVATQSGGDE